MAYKKKPFQTRLDMIEEIKNNAVHVVEDEEGKKVSQKPRLEDIAPVNRNFPTTTTTKKTTTSSEKKKDTWFSSGAFSDGYDFGDITKTILGTTGDVVTGVAKGVFGLGEGIGDTINYGVAGVADLVGQDEWADKYRKEVSKSLTDQIFKPAEDFYDKYSVLGEKSDNITQGLGNVAGIIGTGGIGASAGLGAVGTSALTSGTIGISSMGSGMSEAYQGGATDEEALKYGLISGVAEAGTEMIFGGLGKGVNALGLSKGLSSADDMLAKAVSNKFKTQLAKNLSEYTVKAGAEGLEEVMSGLVQGIGKKVTYMSEEELGKILADEQLLDQFIMGAVTSGVAQAHGLVKTTKAGRDYVSGYTQNEQSVIDKEVENRIGDKKLTNKEISKITDEVKEQLSKGYISTDTIESVLGGDTYTQLQSIRDNKTAIEQEIDQLENKPYAEMTVKENDRLKALREELASIDTNTLENQLQSEMGQKIANDGYLQQSYQEKAKRGQLYEQTETSDNEKINSWQQSFVDAKSNNTSKAHDFSEFGNKIIQDKNISMRAVNYDTLVEEGKMRKREVDNTTIYEMNVNGQWKEVAVNGFKENGVLNINLQSNRAFETTVGHELGEFIKSSDPDMYEELKPIAIELGKADGTYNEATLNKYADLYGENTDNVTDEYVNDKLGELFTNEAFVEQLSTKPSLIKKIISEIKHLVKMATAGSNEQRKLLSLQHKLENKFKEAYQNTDLTKENTNYHIESDQELYNKAKETKQITHMTNNTTGILDSGYITGNLQVQVKGKRPVMYGNEGFILNPEALNYSETLYNGDRGNDYIGEFKDKTTDLNEFIDKAGVDHLHSTAVVKKMPLKDVLAGVITYKGSKNYDRMVALAEELNVPVIENKRVSTTNTIEKDINYSNKSDIRYSLSEKGTLQDSNGNDVTLETSETGTHGTLMAIHNLTEDKMKGILELGGFPFPSIAIMKESTISGNSNFGEISVLFDKNTIDPKANKKNKVYSRDAYTPRFPSVEYDIDSKVVKNIRNIVGNDYQNGYVSDAINMLDNIEDSVNRRGLEETLNNIKKDSSMKYVYMKSVNPSFKELTRAEQYSNKYTNETLKKFVDNYDGKYPLNDIPSSEIDNYVPQMVAAYEEQLREEYAKVKELDADTINELVEAQTKELKEKFYAKDKFLTAAYRLQKLGSDNQIIDTKATNELIDNTINQEEYNKWIDELFSGIIAKKGLRNNKDYYTPSGNRRTFDQLHYEYTLDNVIKIMTELDDTGSESSMMTGINEIAGNVSKRLTSIQDIKNNEYMLQSYTDEEYSAILEEYGDKLFNLQQEILDRGHSNSSNQFIAMDNLGSAISQVARDYGNGERVNANTITEVLSEYGFNPTAEESQTILDMFDEFKELPTEYFEAKPKRAVKLSEAQAIVIPNDASPEFKQQLQDSKIRYYEYDRSIDGDRQRVINQFDDLKFSLSQQNETITRNPNLTYGEDVRLAPLQEEIKTLTETVQELKEQIAPIKESPVLTEESPVTSGQEVEYTQPTKAELDNLMALQKTGGTEYANTFFELRDKYGQPKLYKGINEYKKAPDTYEAPIKGDEFAPITEADLPMLEQQYEEDFKNIDESSMPMETEEFAPVDEVTPTKSLFETRNYEDVGSRKINAYQYDNPEVKPFFQEEAQAMLGDLKSSIKGERSYNDQLYYESGGEQGYFGTERQTTSDIAELLDGMDGKYKYTYADIEKGLNAIIKDEGSENNAISKRIEFYLDQRLREGYTTVDGIEVPANQQYIELLEAKDITDYYNSIPVTDDLAPVENVEKPVEKVSNSNIAEKIAPVKEEYLAITPEKEPKLIKVKDNPTYNQIAEVLVEEPKTESQKNKRKWAIFKANLLDKGIVFEDLSLKENNRELIAKWDYTLTSESRGQYAIGNGHNGLSKSLNDIRAEVDNTGNTKDFYNYMYHKHNIDRMTLATRFEGMENKPVFGDNVTAEQSQAIVNQYEKTHPEFLEFAQDVYDYVNADKQLLIDNGVISQETADLWSQMYPHYVPTRRTTDTGIDINVPLDTRKTGINAPIKKATGGSSDILPLFDTMAMRTLQTYRATAKNSFGVELKNTIGTTVESNQTNVDEVIDSIDAQDGLLQEGKKGSSPTFTVFENGEKITFEITKDMYDALRPLDESSMLSKTYKLPNVISNVRRGLLTEYNPTFLLTNAIKDTQDILLNSQHASRTYSKIPEAHKQLLSKGYWYQEYVANGGEQNSYFDSETNTFKTENKGLDKITNLPPLKAISNLNNHIEMIPRLAEYIASREAGRSIEVSMLDAARVTTNFKAGGAVTKWANRNGATFLNASVQGAMQQVRNIREAKANGVKGWVNLATKFAIAGLPAILLNNLIWDDDEEYDDLSDYVKQNYYVIGKTDDGTFIRIPKGRTVAVIQEGINQMSNLITGDDEVDLKSFIDLMINNLAPNNPLDNNVLSPIIQVANNEAWYGGDLVPTRLQKMPDAEQYDESTDMLSRWLGEIFDYSPYKINYLIDQYSGGLGDVLLPMMTPEAESDGDSITDYLFAPLKSKFTTNSTFNNQNVSDFYDTKEKLTVQANKSNATDEDVLKNKYMNSINSELSELYTQKREIQNSDLPNSEKYKQAKEIQEQINALTKNALSEYTNVSEYSNFATIGDREYYKRINSDGEVEWTKVDGDETDDLNSLGMTEKEKNTYFATKSEISKITKDTEDADAKKSEIIDSILSSGMSDEQKAYLYGKHYSSDETLDKVTDSGISFDDYLTFNKDTLSIESAEQKVEHLYNSDFTDEAKTVIYETSVLSGFDNEDKYKDYKVSKAAGIDINSWLSYKKQEFVADKDSAGNSISGSRKEKIISYINSLDLSIPQKAMLIRQEYSTYRDYNNQIVEYVGGLDVSYEDKVFILEGLDMTVDDDGNVYWD